MLNRIIYLKPFIVFLLNRKQKGETNSNMQNFGYEPIKRQEQTLSKPEKYHYQKNLVTLKN